MKVFPLLLFLFLAAPAAAQPAIPRPADVFGFEPGADYSLADYGQVTDYFQRLDAASDRAKLIEIGTSVQGRPLLVMMISSEANMRQLERWRTMSEELARGRIDEAVARRYAREGKAIVWIDGGMHASEKAHGQMTPELAYRLVAEDSYEMQQIRENVVVLLMPNINPDGLDIVTSWYRKYLGTPYETTGPAWLYHPYVGHDNNRDWFMNTMPESEAVSQVLYNEWYPQIVHNHHQTSPAWARIFLPPFSDPVNPNIHPGVTTGVNLVGSAMANRFAMEKMPGVVSDVEYSMWWNGGMRTAPYFHNQIGILTETAHATPTPRFYDPDSLPPTLAGHPQTPTDGTDIFYPYPWKGGDSRFRDAVDYMITASLGLLNIAADRRERWLYDSYAMARDAIERGSTEAPFAYIVPADQHDPTEALRLVEVLHKTGLEVHRAERDFAANDTIFAAGSYVAFTAQAFRPMLVDVMEPQAYPDRRGPDGSPEVPYDLAGWTLPLQMGVQVVRAETPFEANLYPITETTLKPDAGRLADAAYGYVLSHTANGSALVVNRLLNAGERVSWAGAGFSDGETTYPEGAIIIQKGPDTEARLREATAATGLSFDGLAVAPAATLHALEKPRVGLYKSWVANMDEGWTRWLLERYEFAVDTLHDADLRYEKLATYHAIILPSQSGEGLRNGHAPNTMPAEYTGGVGLEGTLALKQFVEEGGTLLAFDAASDFLIDQFGLPVRNVVRGVSSNRFFIPGSLIRMDVDAGHPFAYGMADTVAASFQQSRAFEAVRKDTEGEGGRESTAEAPAPEVEVVARYAADNLLMSGWALGEDEYIAGKAAMMRVPMGRGNVVLTGFRPQFRGQPGGTFKLIFNTLHAATLTDFPAPEPGELPAPEGQR